MTAAEAGAGDSGFALVEMLVAMAILSLVGLTLARFQTFQLRGAAAVGLAAAARIEADNRIVDALVQPLAPAAAEGTSANLGRRLYWTMVPAPPPDPALTPDLVSITVAVREEPGGRVLARRTVLRPKNLLDGRGDGRQDGAVAGRPA